MRNRMEDNETEIEAGNGANNRLSPLSDNDAIDVSNHRFPYCLVWTPIPLITWLLPFIGHVGICDSDGVIYDFAGPYFVSRDEMAFGWPTRYLNMRKKSNGKRRDIVSAKRWDDGIIAAIQVYQTMMYNFFCNNCHSFAARALNNVYSGGYNMAVICLYVFLFGRFTSFGGLLYSFGPFLFIMTMIMLLI